MSVGSVPSPVQAPVVQQVKPARPVSRGQDSETQAKSQSAAKPQPAAAPASPAPSAAHKGRNVNITA
jgi:hypothetical protein